MKNKIKIGDRCIIIKSKAGNEGRIVEVIDYFNPYTTKFDGRTINKDCTLIITSIGTPLNVYKSKSLMTGPMIPDWLRKLPDVTEPEKQLEIQN